MTTEARTTGTVRKRVTAFIAAAAIVAGGVTVATVTLPRDVEAARSSVTSSNAKRKVKVSTKIKVIKPASALSKDHKRLLKYVNKERKSKGTKALKRSVALDTIAQNWAKHMSNEYFMYHNPDLVDQLPAGWSRAGENVAWAMGYKDNVKRIHTNWMNSKGHRENILNSQYTHVGIGLYQAPDEKRVWAVQVFGRYTGRSPDAKIASAKKKVRVSGTVKRQSKTGKYVAYRNRTVHVYFAKAGSKKRKLLGKAKVNSKGNFSKKFNHPGKGKIIVKAKGTKTYKSRTVSAAVK